MSTSINEQCSDFLYEEARLLDNQNWDAWLNLYQEDASFWIPMWDSDYETTTDPKTQLSLMYYGDRSGLEDRVFRLRTKRSSASLPMPRTCHMVSNVQAKPNGNGSIHVYASGEVASYRHKQTYTFYCHYEYQLKPVGDNLKIASKKITLINDLIHDIVDFYSV